MEVDHAAGLDAGRAQEHRVAGLAGNGLDDLHRLVVDLRTAVLRGRLVAPLAQLEVLRVAQPCDIDRARELDRQPVGLGRDARDLERVLAARAQALEAEALVAPVPVAARADRARVEAPVGPVHEALHATLEAVADAVRATLQLARDDLKRHAVDAAEREFGQPQVALVAAVADHKRRRRRVGDLVLRQPHGGRRRRVLAVEARHAALGIDKRLLRAVVVAVEAARFCVDELARGQPRALVVAHERVARRGDLDAVRGAEAARDPLDILRRDVDAVERAAVRRIRAVEADGVADHAFALDGVPEVDRGRQRAVDPAVLLLQAEGEVVVVVADPRARPLFVRLERAVAVEVAQAVDAGAVRDVDVAVDHDDAARIVVLAGQLLELHGLGRAADDIREDEQRAVGLLAQFAVVHRLEVADDEPAIGQERHAADLRLEALRPQRLDREHRMRGLDRKPVARTRVLAAVLVDLGARGHDARHALLGAEGLGRHDREPPAARLLPVEEQRAAALVLEHVDAERVQPRRERDGALLRVRRVDAVVHDHGLAVDLEPAAVIGAELEDILARGLDREEAERLDREEIGRPARTDERRLVVEVDAVLEAVDVRRGVLGHARDAVERSPDVVDAQGVALLDLGRRSGQQTKGRDQDGEHAAMLHACPARPKPAIRPSASISSCRPSSPSAPACRRSASRSRTRCRTS